MAPSINNYRKESPYSSSIDCRRCRCYRSFESPSSRSERQESPPPPRPSTRYRERRRMFWWVDALFWNSHHHRRPSRWTRLYFDAAVDTDLQLTLANLRQKEELSAVAGARMKACEKGTLNFCKVARAKLDAMGAVSSARLVHDIAHSLATGNRERAKDFMGITRVRNGYDLEDFYYSTNPRREAPSSSCASSHASCVP